MYRGILGGESSVEPPPRDGIVQQAPDVIYASIFSPDETMIASVCGDGVVRISELATGKLIRECVGHDNDVCCQLYSFCL